MAERVWLGIDPGLGGAIALVSAEDRAEVWDTPVAAGAKREYEPAMMAELLRVGPGIEVAGVALEQVHSRPGEGVSGAFRFGVGLGLWQGLLAGLGLPYRLVTPAVWKRDVFRGSGIASNDKAGSRLLAQQRFPALVGRLGRVKDHGRAEALLLAEWLRRAAP